MRTLLCLLAALAPSCGDLDAARDRRAITNAAPTDGWPAVVALVRADGVPFCSGTIVDPRHVLTAAHCLADPEGIEVFAGADPDGEGARRAVTAIRIHPDYDPYRYAADLALLELDEPLDDWLPPTILEDPRALVGAHVRVVGFGLPAGDDLEADRDKREGLALVTSIDAEEIELAPDPSQPCRGDSGGPVFVETEDGPLLVGVVSSGDPACATRARAIRADAHGAFLGDLLVDESATAACAAAPGSPRATLSALLAAAVAALMARPRRSRR